MANYPFKIGKATVNITEGGITNAEVIEYAEQLPTATDDSPNFVQTPDGVLYRKKAVESGGLLGTWVFTQFAYLQNNTEYNLSFTSNGVSYSKMRGSSRPFSPELELYYDDTLVSNQSVWIDDAYKTIQITDISSLTNVEAFTQWLAANATGGGASVSYEYVAMQEVPTPTTADNGKVLGVTNGEYALQEAGGGGSKLYKHDVYYSSGGKTLYATFISNIETEFTEWSFPSFYAPILTNGTLDSSGKTYPVTGVSSPGDTGLVVNYLDPAASSSYVGVWYAQYPENISDTVTPL